MNRRCGRNEDVQLSRRRYKRFGTRLRPPARRTSSRQASSYPSRWKRSGLDGDHRMIRGMNSNRSAIVSLVISVEVHRIVDRRILRDYGKGFPVSQRDYVISQFTEIYCNLRFEGLKRQIEMNLDTSDGRFPSLFLSVPESTRPLMVQVHFHQGSICEDTS